MKRSVIIILTALTLAFCTLFGSCSAAKDGAPDYNAGESGDYTPQHPTDSFSPDSFFAKLTTEGLNDLRSILQNHQLQWEYALVAGDCIFVDGGYYKFESVLYHALKDIIALGDEDERELFFARGDRSVYGVYRARISEGQGDYFTFNVPYDNPIVYYRYLGRFASTEADVGSEGSETVRLFRIGETLFAYDFSGMRVLAKTDFDGAIDFNYYQRGFSAVAFNGFATEILTYDNGFKRTSVTGDYSLTDYPCVIDNVYIFGGEELTMVPLSGSVTDEQKTQLVADYAQYLQKLKDKTATDGRYLCAWNDMGVTVTDLLNQEERTIDITRLRGVGAVAEASAYRGMQVDISAVKIYGGEIFIIVENLPDKFAGDMAVNDGIPQLAIRYDFTTDTLTCCGMVDFPGYNIYRIVKLP